MKDALKELFGSALALARRLYAENPVRVVTYVTSAVIAIAATAGLGIDPGSTAAVVATVLAILFGGEVARQQVTPVAKTKRKAPAKRKKT